MNLPDFKSAIIAQMISTTQEKIDLSKAQITSIQQSKSSATKSTAGDKHETGRAMMETELAFAQSALTKSLQQLADIEKLAESGASDIVEFGSLVETSKGFFIFGVSLGKISIAGVSCFTISAASPIGSAMLGKSTGDSFELTGISNQILSIT
ncbi:MAG: hypothetical protein CMB32_04560 [Euryarchaeota archaeon]|nr:hypothetical protein [Euryarchaeota archaeon]|tara:strand:- start:806 stop:1264 length:459 start_codon:yes stop_codon:yes gene_type:complete